MNLSRKKKKYKNIGSKGRQHVRTTKRHVHHCREKTNVGRAQLQFKLASTVTDMKGEKKRLLKIN